MESSREEIRRAMGRPFWELGAVLPVAKPAAVSLWSIDRRCEDCGRKLTPCRSRSDGEDTFCGFYACCCNEARDEDSDRDEWYVFTPGERQ